MKLIGPSFFILGLFVLGGLVFKSLAPTACDTILQNDSIFVLTGDVRRIPFAMRQMRMHPDARLYIIGAGAPEMPLDANRVTIETDSQSTYQNAVAIRQFANAAGLDRLVLVTTEDHINRARYLVRNELPGVYIAVCPVRLVGMPAAKRLERWTVEYVKYIATMFGIKES